RCVADINDPVADKSSTEEYKRDIRNFHPPCKRTAAKYALTSNKCSIVRAGSRLIERQCVSQWYTLSVSRATSPIADKSEADHCGPRNVFELRVRFHCQPPSELPRSQPGAPALYSSAPSARVPRFRAAEDRTIAARIVLSTNTSYSGFPE